MYAPEKLRIYPHMLPADVGLWERFLERYGHEFAGFDYDVHVGGRIERQSQWTDEIYEMGSSLVAKRIDAIGYRPGETWIIEVKPEAGVTSVGQLVTYRILYISKFAPIVPLVCVLVCSNILPDEEAVMSHLGFRTYVV